MKELLVYGDSLSNGNHGDHAYYPQLEAMGLEVTNRAVGSSGLCRCTPSSMMEQMEKFVDCDYKIVLCWHGTNDWYWGSPLEEFRESMKKAVEVIRERNPFAFILWFGPLFRYEAPDGKEKKGNAFETENKLGKTLLDYISVIEECAKETGIRYVDMNALVQIHKGNAETLLEDWVHPNALGYERIAKVLKEELSRLMA